jgi:hypothetical protein
VTSKEFVFTPSQGAQKIPMIKPARATAQESLDLPTTDENGAFSWVAAGGGRGFVAAGRGYGYGYGYAGARYGAAAYRGGLPAGYYGGIPGAYRSVCYGGYNCYYAGGVYYRPAFYQGNTVYIVVR